MSDKVPGNRVVIVGGGYLGSELAKSLDANMDVTLIERSEAFTHAPAMIRALVDPSLLERALIPYDQLLKAGQVIKGEATIVDETGVTLANGSKIEADFVILATGSGNVAPFKSTTGDIKGLRAANAAWHGALNESRTVAIIGAGAVGTELAGEIASAMPNKKITLISSDGTLFPSLPAKLGKSLETKLLTLGVEVVFGERAAQIPDGITPSGGAVTLSSGREIRADLIFPAVGARLSTDLVAGLPGAKRADDGRILTDQWMRPSSYPNVFAAGDIADNGDLMTIVGVSRQVPWLAKIIQSAARGQTVESQKPYKPWGKAPILIPLGAKRGSSFLVIATVGDWLTSLIKGRDLFLTKYQKTFGREI